MDDIEIIRTWMAAIEAGDRETVASLTDEGFIFEHTGDAERWDRRTFLEAMAALHEAFPDWRHNPDRFHVEGQEVLSRLHPTGTQQGLLDLGFMEGPRIAPTGLKVELATEEGHWQIRDGKVAQAQFEGPPSAGFTGLMDLLTGAPPKPRHGHPSIVDRDRTEAQA